MKTIVESFKAGNIGDKIALILGGICLVAVAGAIVYATWGFSTGHLHWNPRAAYEL